MSQTDFETPMRPNGCAAVTNPGLDPKTPRENVSAPAQPPPPLIRRISDALFVMRGMRLEQSLDSGHIGCRGRRAAARQTRPGGQSKMRSFLVAIAGLMAFAGHSAQAKVDITVDKNNQMMTVAVDGVERYRWPVSTGIPSYETPNGAYRTFRMEEDHYSKEFDDAPMPHSIFFTKIGHAIHGTDSVNRLGSPASHGCVRLSREHAATLYALVQEQGVLNTTVTLTGSSQVALARNPRRGNAAVARRAPQPYEQQYDAAAGDP